MSVKNLKQKSVSPHNFAMIPRADIPRSQFRMPKNLKTTIQGTRLFPILCEEVLPGDTWNARVTVVARTATPIVPLMDNWHMEFFYFFCPNRLVWEHWQAFNGEQATPGASTDYTIPQIVSPANGFANFSVYDYFGIPGVGQITTGNALSINALPLRMYNKIWNEWFRDQNLAAPATENIDDGPDTSTNYALLFRSKRHDYFTSCLPFVQKGQSVTLPLGDTAPVIGIGQLTSYGGAVSGPNNVRQSNPAPAISYPLYIPTSQAGAMVIRVDNASGASSTPMVYADLSEATAATINQLRESFQIQKLLERDARGGTRYTEIVRAHFGVISPDARLQRPEYIGGGQHPIIMNAIPQTAQDTTEPLGTLAATGHVQGRNGFTYSATEHGYIIGLVNVRADLTYQQGLRRHWSRQTRYDYYWPAFAMLGEQAVLNKEIYATGTGSDDDVFGYQERWAEYRYNPSEITGYFRSTTTGTLDYWHSAQRFSTLPTLNEAFIRDDTATVLQRNFAAGDNADFQQFLLDMNFDFKVARPLPMYSVPGLVDHF